MDLWVPQKKKKSIASHSDPQGKNQCSKILGVEGIFKVI